MNMFDNKKNTKNGLSRITIILILFSIIFFLLYIGYKLFFIPDPAVIGTEAFNFLSAEKTIKLQGENLSSLEISVFQGNKKVELLKDKTEIIEKTYILQIKPKDLELTDGAAIILVKAKAGILKEVKYEISSIIDTVPPTLEVVKAPFSINQGSGGFAVLRAKDADSVFVKLTNPARSQENQFFKAFEASKATDSEPESSIEIKSKRLTNRSRKIITKKYYVFLPAPFNVNEGSVFYAIARDKAGNQNLKALPTRLKTKKFKLSSINIDDHFINTVVSPLLNETNVSDPESAFIRINEELRKDSLERLRNIAKKSESTIIWKEHFLQLRNSKVMATYGEQRTYLYNGKKISKSVHLGYDLASFAHASVEASNTGIVRFTGDLGIYGNTIIIDHGLGLMSLYGHLSEIMVKEGQALKKGDIIAKTGATGFAGGDHLHFGIMIHGFEVSPLYWWDQHWINVNVLNYLNY